MARREYFPFPTLRYEIRLRSTPKTAVQYNKFFDEENVQVFLLSHRLSLMWSCVQERRHQNLSRPVLIPSVQCTVDRHLLHLIVPVALRQQPLQALVLDTASMQITHASSTWSRYETRGVGCVAKTVKKKVCRAHTTVKEDIFVGNLIS